VPRRRDVSKSDRRERDENGVPQVFALQSAIGNRASASLMREAAPSSSSTASSPGRGDKQAYIRITGEKQGKFKGSSGIKGREDDIPITTYNMGIKSPRDAASGQATGKRQHQGVSFTKALDETSPQFMEAMASNETLKEVTITFYRPSRDREGGDTKL
jgi:type VI protein secretion system component Hcp